MLLMLTPMLGSWMLLRRHGSITGGTELTSFQQVSIHTVKMWMQLNDSWCYKLLLDKQGKELLNVENKSELEASRQPSAPLLRKSNWLGIPTHWINLEQQTTMPYLQWKWGIQASRPSNNKTIGCPSHCPKLCVLRNKKWKRPPSKSSGGINTHCILLLLHIGKYTYHVKGICQKHQFWLGDINCFVENQMTLL